MQHQCPNRGEPAPTMAELRVFIVCGLVLVVLCTCIWAMRVCPTLLCRRMDIDINSGRTRIQLCALNVAITREVQESRLSREVGRLAIDVPTTPVWKCMFVTPVLARTHDDYTYAKVFSACDLLLGMLDKADIPDVEHQAIIETLIRVLQNGTADDALRESYDLMVAINKTVSDNGDFEGQP